MLTRALRTMIRLKYRTRPLSRVFYFMKIDFTKPKTIVVLLSAITLIIVLLTAVVIIMRHGDSIDYYYENSTVGWGVNKTVGWAWDLYNFTPFFCFLTLVISLSGYVILWISRVRLNGFVSIFNIIVLLAMLIILPLSKLINVLLIVLIAASLSVLLLLVNTIFSIIYKISDKKEKQKR